MILVLVFSLAPPSASADTTVLSSKGATATAGFSSTDSTGCITNLVFIDASQNAVHNPPSAQTFAVGVLVVRFRLNFCTNEFQSTEGFSSTMHFSASPGGARAQGDIVLCDLDSTVGGCQEQTFALDVTWTGVGNVTVDHSTLANLTAAGGFTSTTTGTSRAANATGSMTSGNLNLITTPSSSGVISTAKAHNVILSP